MKAILVSGCVGCGKTTIAKAIADRMDYEYLDVNKVVDSHPNVIVGYDNEMATKDVDVDKLIPVLVDIIKNAKGVLVVDSHFSHFVPKEYVKVCVVVKCSLAGLKKRLSDRKYNDLKVRENLDAEIFDVCFIEALELGHRVVLVDTTDGFDIETVVHSLE